MIRLAFSTNAFKQNTLYEAIDSIAEAGYGGVEIMADVPHAYPPHFSPDQQKHLLQYIGERKLAVSNVNAFTLFAVGDTYHPTWIEDDAAKVQQRVDHTLSSIDLAANLGSKTVSLQPGGPLVGMSIDEGAALKRFAEGLNRVLPVAKACRITLAVEPEPGLLIQTTEEYLRFKRDFFADEDAIRMNCDIGHLFCVGDDPAEAIRANPAEIAHVHLEDIGENRVHQHLAPGDGVIDFGEVFAALKAIDYGGWVTVELYPFVDTAAEVARKAIKHLQPMV